MPLDGTLRDISLPSLVQLQCVEQKRAQVSLTRRNIEGALVFADGELLHAMVGPLVGEDAVYEMLTWDEGSFHVSENVTQLPVRNVRTPWQTLVLEGLRRADEIKSERAQAVAEVEDTIRNLPGIAEWHLCTIDGQQLNASGESASSQIGEWTARALREGALLAQALRMGELREMVFSNSTQKRILVARERYWLAILMDAHGAIGVVRDAVSSTERR